MTNEYRFKCLRITAYDGTVRRFALQPSNVTMTNDSAYIAPPMAKLSDRNVTIDGGPTVLDFESVYDSTTFTRDELQSGKWDGAEVKHFATSWDRLIEDDEEIDILTLGKITDKDDRFIAELIGQQDKLNHSIGRTITAKCGKVFANTHLDGEPIISNAYFFCGVSAAANTVTGTITSVDDASNFYDSSRTEDDDWFGAGEIIFTSGDNSGLSRRTVSAFINSSGKISVNYPFYYTPEVGDSYQMIAGCRKRHAEDCVTKFNNGPDFGGFPSVPTKSIAEQKGTKI